MGSAGPTVCTLPVRTDWLLPGPVHEVAYCQDGVPAKHAGSGIAHHGLDLVSHGRLEAVDRALGASRLCLLERAFLKTLAGIGQELTAINAWLVTTMLAAAVEVYHDRYGLAFPGHSGVSLIHDRPILPQKRTPIHNIDSR